MSDSVIESPLVCNEIRAVSLAFPLLEGIVVSAQRLDQNGLKQTVNPLA
jgi:hypothetical protein